VGVYVFTNTQEANTHSAAPSKCIHSGTQTFHIDMTSTCKQNNTRRNSTANQAFASIPSIRKQAWCIQEMPLHSPTLNLSTGPATKALSLTRPGHCRTSHRLDASWLETFKRHLSQVVYSQALWCTACIGLDRYANLRLNGRGGGLRLKTR
jgi:hypothetical protein